MAAAPPREPPVQGNGWPEYRRYIISQIDDVQARYAEIERRLERFDERLAELKTANNELAALRPLVEEWRRYKWFSRIAYRSVAWTAGVIFAIWTGREFLGRVIGAFSEVLR